MIGEVPASAAPNSSKDPRPSVVHPAISSPPGTFVHLCDCLGRSCPVALVHAAKGCIRLVHVIRRYGSFADLLKLCLAHSELPTMRRVLSHGERRGRAALQLACSLISPEPHAHTHNEHASVREQIEALSSIERWRFVYRCQLALSQPTAAGAQFCLASVICLQALA